MKHKCLAWILVLCLLISCYGCAKVKPGSDPTTQPTSPSSPTAPSDPTNPPEDKPDPKPSGDEASLIVNDHTISHREFNYFYIDAINEFVTQNSNYIYYILDISAPLSSQTKDQESGETWAKYFLDVAIESTKNTYAIYDAAVAANHVLSEDEQKSVQNLAENLEEYAKYYKYDGAEDYLAEIYGDYANLQSYCAYYEIMVTVSSYYNAYAEELLNSYTEPVLREFEAEKAYEYNSYSYATYFLASDSFTKEGFTVEDAAKQLASIENNTIDQLNAAITALEKGMDDDKSTSTTATIHNNELYANIDSQLQEWVRSSARQIGDIAYLPYSIEGTFFSPAQEGYCVILLTGIHDNQFPLANVRHILAIFEGSTEENKKAAKEQAEKIYKEWLEGEKTEDSFAELAKEYTDDSNGDAGGLYENVYPGQMVPSFNDWCFDESRLSGDHGIVETEYGYHVMYYSGDSDTTFRDFMVSGDKQYEDLNAWQTALNEASTQEILDTSGVDLDYVIYESK